MKYTVTVKAVYIREMEIEADDDISARHVAIAEFEPEGDDMFSIDVFGLDPWQPTNNDEDYAYETARQQEIDNEA